MLRSIVGQRYPKATTATTATTHVTITNSPNYTPIDQGVLFPSMPLNVPGPNVGDLAPDFTLTDTNGEPVYLEELRGRPLVIVFYRGGW